MEALSGDRVMRMATAVLVWFIVLVAIAALVRAANSLGNSSLRELADLES